MPELNDAELKQALDDLVERFGRAVVARALGSVTSPDRTPLVLVGNCGLHPIPDLISDADIFCATSGNLDFSDSSTINQALRDMIAQVSDKLRERPWSDIYILPFGHPVFSMYLKMTVYRVLGRETLEIFHQGGGKYAIVGVDDRGAMLKDA